MASISTPVYKFMAAHPMLKANRDVWHHIYPGKLHTYEAWLQRMWNAFKILSMGRNWAKFHVWNLIFLNKNNQ